MLLCRANTLAYIVLGSGKKKKKALVNPSGLRELLLLREKIVFLISASVGTVLKRVLSAF